MPSSIAWRSLDYYRDVPSDCPLKAKAAFALGHYFLRAGGEPEMAEEILLECLFVLDTIEAYPAEDIPMVNQIGTSALVVYGDTLMYNGKYKYAIAAYESAAKSYQIREKVDFEKLTRRLCTVCMEQKDWDRALRYHLKILHSSKTQGNINEFIFLSERISDLLLYRRANFQTAESYLRVAISALDDRSTSGAYFHTDKEKGIKLKLRLANVLLCGNRAEDACRMIASTLYQQGLAGTIVRKSRYAQLSQSVALRVDLLLLLAQCCLKLRWLVDCEAALQHLSTHVLAISDAASAPKIFQERKELKQSWSRLRQNRQ